MKKSNYLLLTGAMLGTGALLMTGCGSKSNVTDYSKYVSLGDYENLTVDRVVLTVTDDDVQEEVASELSYMSESTEITDRAAQDGDTVVIDFVGTIDGEEFDDGSAEDYELELGSDSFLDGFEDQIVGMEIGDTKNFDITFPDPYDGVLDGQTANFEVTLKQIYEVTLPEYDASFVSSISDYDNVEDYESALKEELQASYDEESNSTACENALYEIIENSTFSGYPDDLYEQCKTQIESENQEFADLFGVDDITELFGEDYDEEAAIEEQVNETMVVNTLAAKEKIDVSDEDYEAALQEELDTYGEYDSLDELKENTDEQSYRYQLLRQKVLDYLATIVTFNDVTEDEYYSDDEEVADDTSDEDVTDEEVDEEGTEVDADADVFSIEDESDVTDDTETVSEAEDAEA